MKIDAPQVGSAPESRSSSSADSPVAVRPSAAITNLIDRLRTRLNLGIELLDAALLPIAPLAGGEFYAALLADPAVPPQISAAAASGRAQSITAGSAAYFLQPLRAPGRGRRTTGVLVIPQRGGTEACSQTEAWADVLRSVIEADIAQVEVQSEERIDARRAAAALRFLSRAATFETETDLLRGIIHAAAVWFDVDARVYRKSFGGDFILHTHLPGISPTQDAMQLSGSVVGTDRIRRIPFVELPNELRWSPSDVLLLSVTAGDFDEWVLALGGRLPPSADTLMAAMTQTMGALLAVRLEQRLEDLRALFENIISMEGTRETIAAAVLRQLLDETGATAGMLTLHHDTSVERLAAFGSAQPAGQVPHETLLAPDQLIYPMALGAERTGVLDLRTEGSFTRDGSRALLAAGKIVHAWLAGMAHEAPRTTGGVPAAAAPAPDAAFARRISEELERAKRFDLGLSIVLIDLNHASTCDEPTVHRMVDAVRHELRGSDLLGILDDGRIAALLVHTDAAGMTSVVPRLRRRVADVSRTLGVDNPRFGRAAFSHEIRTASALVSEALRDLQAVR